MRTATFRFKFCNRNAILLRISSCSAAVIAAAGLVSNIFTTEDTSSKLVFFSLAARFSDSNGTCIRSRQLQEEQIRNEASLQDLLPLSTGSLWSQPSQKTVYTINQSKVLANDGYRTGITRSDAVEEQGQAICNTELSQPIHTVWMSQLIIYHPSFLKSSIASVTVPVWARGVSFPLAVYNQVACLCDTVGDCAGNSCRFEGSYLSVSPAVVSVIQPVVEWLTRRPE